MNNQCCDLISYKDLSAMSELKVISHAMFNISVEQAEASRVDLEHGEGDFQKYCGQLLDELLENTRSKSLKFRAIEEFVPAHLNVLVNDQNEWDKRTLGIAEKLLSVEIDAQDKIKAMKKKIKKGALLILLLSRDNNFNFVILKIEHSDFFDEIESKIKKGLPLNRQRLQKSCLVSFSNTYDVEEILISDSGASISEYWWKNFLSTVELQSSELNTKNAFGSIENFLKREVEKHSSVDYWYMRNDIIAYFRNNEQFAYDELVEKVRSHKPESPAIDERFDQIIEKFKALPDHKNSKFDRQFQLEPNVIRARIKKTIALSDNIELRINGEVADFRKKIVPESDALGKYLKIYSDTGYEEFSAGKEDNV